ncbi:MAG: TonB-dependent receptor [Myxococcota bacterium]|jgi:TonB family protein|nr:TonB-dependent receptor [Myxococcota bacterium]
MRRLYLFSFALLALYVLPLEAEAQNPGDTVSQPNADAEAPLVPPTLVRGVQAQYPEKAAADGVSADVVLEIDVSATGTVDGVRILTPAGPTGYGFDEAAVAAAEQFIFEPATENGIAVPVTITYRTNFALSVPGPEPGSQQPSQEGPGTASTPTAQRPGIANFVGTLKERGTRLPLSGVTVVVFRGKDDTQQAYQDVTDEKGAFEFFDLEPGEWKLYADATGHFPVRTRETINENEKVEATYYAERGSYNPYDVLIEGLPVRKEVSRTTLSVREAERIPGTFGDVLNVIQNLPGVARTAGPSLLVIRGSAPEDSEIVVDGVDVPILYHFGGLRSVIPNPMLERIDFYPGNFSAQYSRATGGIVDVQLKRLQPPKLGGYLDVSLIDASLYLEAPIGKNAAVAIGGRRSYIDGVLSLAVPDSAQVNLVTAPRYYDGQFLARWKPSPGHELMLFVFGSDDKLKLLFENPADISPDLAASDASTSTSFYRTMIEYRYVPSEKLTNDLRVSGGRNWVNFGLGEQLFFDLNTYLGQVRDTLTYQASDALTLRVGVDYQLSATDSRIAFPKTDKEGETSGGVDFSTTQLDEGKNELYHSAGGFVEAEATLWKRLLLVPGLRFDYFSRVDASALAPRLSARLLLSDEWTLKGGVGQFYQEPSFDETDNTFGNPDLWLERATHYSLGAEYRPLPHLVLDATGFYKSLDHLVARSDEVNFVDGQAVPEKFNNDGVGRVYGLELMIRHEPYKNFSGWIAYTVSRSERRDPGQNGWRLFDFDQTHILTAVGTYDLPRNWSVGARFRLVSGRPTTPFVGGVYMVDDSSYAPIVGRANSERLPMFHQLDLRADKRWIYERWILTAYLDIQNVYNRANTEGYVYNFDYSKKGVRQGLPLIPVLGLKGEF